MRQTPPITFGDLRLEVTKEELFRLCWTFVTTVGRRGYRFAVEPDSPAVPVSALVGRNRDARELRAALT